MELMLITDGRGHPDRIVELTRAALAAGFDAVQIREPAMAARELTRLCARLSPEVTEHDAKLIVNDRADVAAAGACDGVHLGFRSIRPEVVRRFVPEHTLIGVSAHDARELARAAAAGADYATLSPVFATASHPEAVPLGVERARQLGSAAELPVLLLGGVDAGGLAALGWRPDGVAVLGAVCRAADPSEAAADIARAWRGLGGE